MSLPLVAAVPVKDLVNAKQRLVPALSPAERRALARAMLEDVLEAMVAALPGAVIVVTTDEEVRALAETRHVTCWIEPANRGHTAAVAFAQREAAARGAERFLTIPGDVPCVTPDELSRLCRALDGPGVAFVPSRSGHGSEAPYGFAGSQAASTSPRRSVGSPCSDRSRSTAPVVANCAAPSPSTK